jgi:hypothetical protein
MIIKNKFIYIDLLMLSLMIVSLPSLEAPKNIFLVGYLIMRIISEVIQFKQGIKQWKNWDYLFLIIIFTAFLSTVFAGFSGLEEWKGYKVFLTAILVGWFLSRAHYSQNQFSMIFKLIILSTIPPLAFGLYEYQIINSRATLEIHSVGHSNHSAIYLVMIFGASLAWFLNQTISKKKVGLDNLLKFALFFFITNIFYFFNFRIIKGSFGRCNSHKYYSYLSYCKKYKNKNFERLEYFVHSNYGIFT